LLRLAGITVQLDVTDRLPLTYLDATRFEQLLDNLIDNAEAAIEARKKRQRSGATHPAVAGEIRISTRREAQPDRITIDVSDNGTGIQADDLTRIFDPFFTTRANGQGAGLGLSACYGIVREHGGTIRAHNRNAGGASFVVELPITPQAYQRDEPASSLESTRVSPLSVAADERAQAVAAKRPTALVVDDEESNATLMRRALDIAGYDVESTTLSRRALTLIERTPYDVVVTDIKMPDLAGQELYAQACQIRPEMARRFIFVTGDIDGSDTLSFLERSRCGFLMKPFNLERLTTAVDMLVGGHRDEAAG
jgi:CheY-like chemotaxis protein